MYLLRRLFASWRQRTPITLQTLPIDLLISILSEPELSPLDLVSLRKTCKALRDVLALRVVWLARAKEISAEDDTFCGDDDLSDVPLSYLENIVAAPFRITHFLENICRGDAQETPPCLPVQLAERFSLLKSSDPEDAVVRAVTIVRGGRYLIYVCADELRLLDLWRSSRLVDEMLVASLALPHAFFYTVDDYWLTDDCELWVALTLRSADNTILLCRAAVSSGGGRCLRVHAQITALQLRYCYRCGDLIAFSDGSTVGVWDFMTGAQSQWRCERLVLQAVISSHILFCAVAGSTTELHGFAIPDMISASPVIQDSQHTRLIRQDINTLRVNPTNMYILGKDNARHINHLRRSQKEDAYFTLDVLQIVAVSEGGIAQMVDYPDESLVAQHRYTTRLGATFRDWYVSVWPQIHRQPCWSTASSVLAIFAKRPVVDENGSSEAERVFKNAPGAGDYVEVTLLPNTVEPLARNQGFDPTSGTYWNQTESLDETSLHFVHY